MTAITMPSMSFARLSLWGMVSLVLLMALAAVAWAWWLADDTRQHFFGSVPEVTLEIKSGDIPGDAETPITPKPVEEPKIDLSPAPLPKETLELKPVGTEAQHPVEAAKNLVMSDPELLEKGINGRLPKVGKDGRAPWQVYAAPVAAGGDQPRIAVVITEMGLDRDLSQQLIDRLPLGFSLSFSPYAINLDPFIVSLRHRGFEFLINLPMEGANYPIDDPGPKALLTSLKQEENLSTLRWIMTRAEGYVGLVGFMGGKFSTDAEALNPILGEIKKRGLMYVDNREAPNSEASAVGSKIGLPRVDATQYVDRNTSRIGLANEFRKLEEKARSSGYAVLVVEPSPRLLTELPIWVDTLQKKNLRLVPVTSLAAVGQE